MFLNKNMTNYDFVCHLTTCSVYRVSAYNQKHDEITDVILTNRFNRVSDSAATMVIVRAFEGITRMLSSQIDLL